MGLKKDDRYRKILEAEGIRPTLRRMVVLRAISESRRPVSASEIMAFQGEHGLTMDKATLYRTLNLFMEKGLIQRLSSGDGSFRFGMGRAILHQERAGSKEVLHDHPHFFCTACGRMSCLASDAVNVELPSQPEVMPGRALKIEIRIDGICSECQKRGEGN